MAVMNPAKHFRHNTRRSASLVLRDATTAEQQSGTATDPATPHTCHAGARHHPRGLPISVHDSREDTLSPSGRLHDGRQQRWQAPRSDAVVVAGCLAGHSGAGRCNAGDDGRISSIVVELDCTKTGSRHDSNCRHHAPHFPPPLVAALPSSRLQKVAHAPRERRTDVTYSPPPSLLASLQTASGPG